MKTVCVFAYGSNMCSGRLRVYGVVPLGTTIAKLQGFELRFHKRSNDGSGKADVISSAEAAAEIWGVIYEIEEKDLSKLDNGEKGYYRTRISLVTREGASIEAFIYLADQSQIDSRLLPYTWYKRFLLEGAKEHQLPPKYISQLEAIQAQEDKNIIRDKEMRSVTCA